MLKYICESAGRWVLGVALLVCVWRGYWWAVPLFCTLIALSVEVHGLVVAKITEVLKELAEATLKH